MHIDHICCILFRSFFSVFRRMVNGGEMTATLFEKLKIIYNGGMVKRYHNRPVLHNQNNAEHQYMVASIACLLYPEISAKQLKNMLWHDVYEYETGDMPWAIKRANPDIKAAIMRIEEKSKERYKLTTKETKFEHAVLKLSEYFECMVFCTNEKHMGNKEYNDSFYDCADQIDILNLNMLKHNKQVYLRSKEILAYLNQEWENV